jgi:hypothetical protein
MASRRNLIISPNLAQDEAVHVFAEPGRTFVDRDVYERAIGALVPVDSLLRGLADGLDVLVLELADATHREVVARLAARARAGAAIHGHRPRGGA